MKVMLETASRRPGWPVGAVIAAVVWALLGGGAVYAQQTMGMHESLCLFKKITGVPCPTCGFTRGVLAMLGGDIIGGWLCNPLLFTALMLMLVAVLFRAFFARRLRFVMNRRERTAAWAVIVALSLSNWAYVIFFVG